MQYTVSSPALLAHHDPPWVGPVLAALTPTVQVHLPASTLTVPLWTLPALFAAIPDPRHARGCRYRVPALLAAVLAALLCNHLSQLAAAEWLRDQLPAIQRALGFVPGRTPHQCTFNRVLALLDPNALATVIHHWFDPPPPLADPPRDSAARPRGSQGVALDGKAQRGRFHSTPLVPGTSVVHEVAAFCAELGTVLAAAPVTGHEDKAAAELNTAPLVIAQVNWAGRVLTGDALLCQRTLCEQVVAAGGDYLFTVKANQGHLLDALQRWFAPEPPRRYDYAPVATDKRETATCDRQRGRLEIRYLCATEALAGVLDWPHLAQVFMVIRSWQCGAAVSQEQHWGITSLPAAVAGVERLLELRRGHWGIENRLHYVKDVTMGEDASLLHEGHGPAVMSLLRDTVVSALHQAGHQQIAARLRYHARHPAAALALLGLTLPDFA
ncbi:MAG: ISAs1 family transposase [Chloroflexota bacterium]|nr:ISAs1 family transposase [Chloroflexota bacterium]